MTTRLGFKNKNKYYSYNGMGKLDTYGQRWKLYGPQVH